MRSCRWLCAMKARKASAVVAKPPGTETPRSASWPIISPSEEFLPPTWARSDRRRSRSHRILAVKRELRAGEGRRMPAEAAILASHRQPAVRVSMTSIRPVFYVSDGTGITAETIGHTVLTQFAGTRFVTDRIPFVDNVDKARATVAEIRRAGDEHGTRPIVVNSCVDPALTAVLAESGALMLDVFEPFIAPLERELGE